MIKKNPEKFSLLGYAAFAFLALGIGQIIFSWTLASYGHLWKYNLPLHDSYSYWAFTKGVTEEPDSQGNPFYYEERGKKHTIPYPTVALFGTLSKIFNLPVTHFIPVWQIGMPFLLWLSLFLCLTRLWGYPRRASALFALAILISLLYLRGVFVDTLFRYSRPGDGLWLFFVWISLLMNIEAAGRSRYLLAGICITAAVWLSPFWGFWGAAITLAEMLWQWRVNPGNRQIRFRVFCLLVTFAAFASLGLYIVLHMDQNPWLFGVLKQEDATHTRNLLFNTKWEKSSLLFYPLCALLVWGVHSKLKTPWTRLDRLMLFLIFMDPLCGNIQALIGQNFQFGLKRFYYFAAELAVLAGWFIEKTPLLIKHPATGRHLKWCAAVAGTVLLASWLNPRYGPLRYGPAALFADVLDGNSLILLPLTPALFLLAWVYHRFEIIRRLLTQKMLPFIFVVIFSWTGFYLYGLTHPRRHLADQFPFEGAYGWLCRYAEPASVVLTVPPSHQMIDYLILYTPMKTYISPWGEELSRFQENPDNRFRFGFYFGLLANDWKNFRGDLTPREKLNRLKLDYVLIDLPSPFLGNIAGQLADHLKLVYKDSRCALWRVLP